MSRSTPLHTRAGLALTCLALSLLLAPPKADAGDWAQFRGPQGNGISSEKNLPTRWSNEENVKWKTPLPGPGNSSPIVSNGRVFVACAENGGRKRSLICLDRRTGKELWVQSVNFAAGDPTHKTNPYAGSTPAADGSRVVVWHGSAGLHCYDFEGKPLWSRELGEFKHMWGYGASPILHEGRILMNCGPGKRVYLGCFDLKDGKTIWEQNEPIEGDGQRTPAGKPMGSWATPIVIGQDGKKQVVCTMPTRVCGYDLETGALLWFCKGIRGQRGDLAYSSALVADGYCVATGGYRGPSIGFPLGGSGDLTPKRDWRKPENDQSIGSGIMLGDVFFMANAGPNTLECIESKTGRRLWRSRSPAKAAWGSILHADGHLYVTGQDGATVVFKPNRKRYEEVAVNRLNETCNSTPAFSDGQIFIRTHQNVYCIGSK